ncbi:MAG: endonuclease/exonuclease/phosphatase family protein [bacterium]
MTEGEPEGDGIAAWSLLRISKAPAVLALCAIPLSSILTDRLSALQWLWWTPRFLLAGAAFAWLLVLFALARYVWRSERETRRLVRWSIAALCVFAWTLLGMWGFPKSRAEGSIRLVHWNPADLASEFAVDAALQLRHLEPDVLVVTDCGTPLAREISQSFGSAGYTMAIAGKFLVCARGAIGDAQPIVAARDRYISRIRCETRLGPIQIEAVDLPSRTTLPRYHALRSLRADLHAAREERGLSEPDLLCGDFNVPRGSASLDLLAPDAREAFDSAGVGWGASYPRPWSFLGIDLTLVRAPWRPVRSEIIDFGCGRHRGQIVDLVVDGVDKPANTTE